jgi:hypothetical protein
MEPLIPVWAIIGQWKAEEGDAGETAAAYHITREELEAVLAFYERHRAAIDGRLVASCGFPLYSVRRQNGARCRCCSSMAGSKSGSSWPSGCGGRWA